MSSTSNNVVSPHLRAVPNCPQTAWIGDRPGIDLRAWPFRPGEAPVSRFAELPHETAETARQRSHGAGLPLALWVRVGVEASRAVASITRDTGAGPETVTTALTAAARDQLTRADEFSGRDWISYAEALLSGRWMHLPRNSPIEVLLPEEIAVAWERDAARDGLALGEWIAAALAAAPADCVMWEAASARELRSLGEWAYRAWVRRSAESSASPYLR